MRKKLGISYTKTNFHFYIDWFTEADLKDVELVVLSFENNNSEDIYSCDGFVLTGGVDIDPQLYGGDPNYVNKQDLQPERDLFEKRIFEHAMSHQLPVLAICRGMQLVNVILGGKLIQDLGKRNEQHRKEGNTDKTHEVMVHEGCLLSAIIGKGKHTINSAHHQSVQTEALGRELKISAQSEDGIVEGVEWKDKKNKPFLLGVQWHPERREASDEVSLKLKNSFLKELRSMNQNKLTIINPATEEIITELTTDSASSLQLKFEQLKRGHRSWQKTGLSKRVAILQNFSTLLQKNRQDLASILSSEMGKPVQQATNEINGACTRIKWLTEHAEQYLKEEIMYEDGSMVEKIVYEPLGVIGNISAWNYPYLVGVNVFIPALLGGNAVLYKPSEYASLTGLQIDKYLKEAGIPDDVFQVAIGKGNVGEIMLDLPLDGYFFTGSYKTGKYIYEKVASKMVPCHCELGGKDPLYVTDDIQDIKSVAAATADGAFYNNGQSCCAVERIYVHESIYDPYITEFIKEVGSYKTGLPAEEGVYIGPLSRKEQVKLLQEQIEDAKKKGASVLTGGNAAERKGYYFQPTVVTDVNHEMKLMMEESFGPVIGIMKVSGDEEAISLMQDTEFGLTASVYSSSRERAERILEQVDAGTGYWNCCDRVSAALPWSGRKHSGFGSSLSHIGLRAFVKPKSYHLRNL